MNARNALKPLASVLALTLIALALPPGKRSYDLSWYTIDGGGVMHSTGGWYDTIGGGYFNEKTAEIAALRAEKKADLAQQQAQIGALNERISHLEALLDRVVCQQEGDK